MDKKLKKHEAFAGELRANEVRIKNINRAGEKLVQVIPEKEREIKDAVAKLNDLWEELVHLSQEKYDKLKQAEAQASFNKVPCCYLLSPIPTFHSVKQIPRSLNVLREFKKKKKKLGCTEPKTSLLLLFKTVETFSTD